jgi:general secretion pathway protein G
MKILQRGYTLLELMIVVVLVGILTTGAFVSYRAYIERARNAQAIGDLGEIHIAIQNFLTIENRGYPANLAELELDNLIDPWGNPYQYLVVEGLVDLGPARKDQNLLPVNLRYDIYSMGKDGQTSAPLNSSIGEDDVVMAGDGAYFGLGKNF